MNYFLSMAFFLLPYSLYAQYSVPEDFMNQPVLVLMQDSSSGSGFFIEDSFYIYFVTARHVFIKEVSDEKGKTREHKFKSELAEINFYPRNSEKSTPNILLLNLKMLADSNEVKFFLDRDALIVRIGIIDTVGYTKVSYLEGVKRIGPKSRINHFSAAEALIFNDCNVSEEVFIFGYPTTLGLKEIPQYDFNRPLLRKGVVAGKNHTQKTLVIDCPAYGGNSGGPVILIRGNQLGSGQFRVGFEMKLIGLVTQFIPFVEKGSDKNYHFNNSGYSIVEPIDSVIGLVKDHRRMKNLRK